eukprot:scaffold72454_cov31-Tisochrysis_lutea.AAC.3
MAIRPHDIATSRNSFPATQVPPSRHRLAKYRPVRELLSRVLGSKPRPGRGARQLPRLKVARPTRHATAQLHAHSDPTSGAHLALSSQGKTYACPWKKPQADLRIDPHPHLSRSEASYALVCSRAAAASRLLGQGRLPHSVPRLHSRSSTGKRGILGVSTAPVPQWPPQEYRRHL